MSTTDDPELIRRALAGYFRAGDEAPPVPDRCTVEQAKSANAAEVGQYVCLRDYQRLLAVFKVRRHDGMLKRLKRWPNSLDTLPAQSSSPVELMVEALLAAQPLIEDEYVLALIDRALRYGAGDLPEVGHD